jgi:hypothetical protein
VIRPNWTATALLIGLGVSGLIACSSDSKTTPAAATSATGAVSSPTAVPVSSEGSTPELVTIPTESIASDLSTPDTAVDEMIAQLAAAGLIVDKACFEALLKDDSLRGVVAKGGTPPPEAVQKFKACIQK